MNYPCMHVMTYRLTYLQRHQRHELLLRHFPELLHLLHCCLGDHRRTCQSPADHHTLTGDKARDNQLRGGELGDDAGGELDGDTAELRSRAALTVQQAHRAHPGGLGLGEDGGGATATSD